MVVVNTGLQGGQRGNLIKDSLSLEPGRVHAGKQGRGGIRGAICQTGEALGSLTNPSTVVCEGDVLLASSGN